MTSGQFRGLLGRKDVKTTMLYTHVLNAAHMESGAWWMCCEAYEVGAYTELYKTPMDEMPRRTSKKSLGLSSDYIMNTSYAV
jgi:hypothetical protein